MLLFIISNIKASNGWYVNKIRQNVVNAIKIHYEKGDIV